MIRFTFHNTVFFKLSIVIFVLFASLQFLPAQGKDTEVRPLTPDQTIEREMTGVETHRYQFTLQKDELFQVYVEQKGLDVALKLRDAAGAILVTMDSPNDKEGPEILTFIPTATGNYQLEVGGFDKDAGKGAYIIRRAGRLNANALDRQRVNAEKFFVEGMSARQDDPEEAIAKLEKAQIGWSQLRDADMLRMTTDQLSKLGETRIHFNSYPLPDKPIERRIIDSVPHLYRFSLDRGQILSVELQEKGVDIFMSLAASQDGEPIRLSLFNSGTGRETITYIAQQSGVYEIGIVASKSLRPGSYYLNPMIKNSPTIEDARRIEATNLLMQGLILFNKKPQDIDNAVKAWNAGADLWHGIGDKYWEAHTLNWVAKCNIDLNRLTEATEALDRAVPLWDAINDKNGKAGVFRSRSAIFLKNNQKRKAIESLHNALDLLRETGDFENEAECLMELSYLYGQIAEKTKMSVYHLAAGMRIKDEDMDRLLSETGLTQKAMGDLQWAKEAGELALIYAKLGANKPQQAILLRNLADIALRLGHPTEAWEKAKAAVVIEEQFKGNHMGLAFALGYMSEIKLALNEPQQALQYIERSLSLVGSKKYTKILLWAGEAYSAAGDHQKALRFLKEALLLAIRAVSHYEEARVLKDLMVVWRALNNPRLAVFYGKQAVNVLQTQRDYFHDVDQRDDPQAELVGKNTQKGFLHLYEEIYRQLADLLIEENRRPEALEALVALKDQQAWDFGPAGKDKLKMLSATLHETRSATLYKEIADRVAGVKFKLHKWMEESEEDTVSIKRIPKKRQEISEEEKYQQDEATVKELDNVVIKLSGVIDKIDTDYGSFDAAVDKVPDVPVVRTLQSILRRISAAMGQPPVVVYQLVTEERVQSLLVTDNDIEWAPSPVKRAELNEKALWLWALLQSDAYDPTLLSSELYDMVFKPIEAKLPKGTKTILWSLDEHLKYLPMGALYDGKKYLVERYDHVLFTRVNEDELTKASRFNWTGLGFATSKPYKIEFLEDYINFEQLDFARNEMLIFKNDKNSQSGVVTGDVFSDEGFTRKEFINALKQNRSLIHISSHFYFRPGDEFRSFLLLGDGSIMTLADMREQKGLFQGVELLTLSACNTAAQLPDSDGREIDGFAELAQRLGAESVMATLWQVNEKSTAMLLTDFYKKRQTNLLSKADALQKAQITLLHQTTGKEASPEGSEQKKVTKGFPEIDDIKVEKKYLIPFEPDRNRRFAHPYYWAPFVLFGNWK